MNNHFFKHCCCFIAILVSCSVMLSVSPAQDKKGGLQAITVVADDNYPPYIFRDAKGNLQGILVDEWKLWGEKTGIKAVLTGMNWEDAKAHFNTGKADVIDTIFFNEQRAKLYDFTKPYAKLDVPVFFHKNLGGIVDIESLQGFTIGVKAGDACIDVLKSHGITGLKEYNSYEAIVKAARDKQIKVFSIDKPPALYYLYKMNLEDEFRYSLHLYTGEFHRAVLKGRKELLRTVEDGFALITKSEREEIEKKWLGESFIKPEFIRTVIVSASAAGALLFILIFFNLTLRRSVRLKTAELFESMQKFKKSEEKYRELVENANSIILRRNRDGYVTFINEFAVNFFGYGESEILGKHVVGTIVPEQESTGRNLAEMINDISEHPELYINNTNENILRNGERVWIAWTNRPICDDSGNISEILCIGNDITSRKKSEEALEQFKSAVEASFDAIFMMTPRGGNWYQNKAFDELFGTPAKPSLSEYFEDRKLGVGILDKTMKGENLAGEVTMTSKDGKPVQIYLRAYSVRDNIGRISRHVFLLTDLTEPRRIAEEKRRLQEQLVQAQKMEYVGRLAGGVAHDFNNMLSIIIGRAELALMYLNQDDPYYKDFKEIEIVGKRSADLTRQLLAFARKQAIAPKIIDLNDLIDNMIQMLRRLIGEDIDLVWKPYEDLWPVKMDPSQINQLLVNLLVNARDSIEDVGLVTIETDNREFDRDYAASHPESMEGRFAMLAVSDNGSGMDPDTVKNIFEPFFTTKELGKGTGLGLSTVYGIIKQNNGFINVYSEPGSGTTFRIYLPRFIGETDDVQVQGPENESRGGTETVLLVEDEKAILDVARTMLENLGYNLLTASTPGDAVKLALNYKSDIHLLMTDVVMPEMNGRDLASQLKNSHPELKVLFMSGYTANVIAHHGVLEKGVHFIQKPFSNKDLAFAIRAALD